MKYYIDSDGIAHETKENYSPESKSVLKRALDLGAVLGAGLSDLDLDVNKQFDYMIEPLGNKENILFFTKTPLSASDAIVKKANLAASTSSYKFANKREKDILESIYATEESGKTRWWLISAEMICLERNSYDNRYISLKHKVMPYAEFVDSLSVISVTRKEAESYTNESRKQLLLQKTVSTKYQFVSSQERKYSDPSDVIVYSIEKNTEFKESFKKVLNDIFKSCNIASKDKSSNEKNKYLELMRTRVDKIYPVFVMLKTYLKKTQDNVLFVNYKKNIINFSNSKGITHIGVSGTQTSPVFTVNGKIYYSVADFKKAAESGDLFIKSEWYDSIKASEINYIKSCYKTNKSKIFDDESK